MTYDQTLPKNPDKVVLHNPGVIGESKIRRCIGTSITLKQHLRRASIAALVKTHVLLHRRQQLARELEAWRVATEEREAQSDSQSIPTHAMTKIGYILYSSSKTESVSADVIHTCLSASLHQNSMPRSLSSVRVYAGSLGHQRLSSQHFLFYF